MNEQFTSAVRALAATAIASAALAALLMAAPARATTAKMVHGSAGGFDYQVVLPAGYDRSTRRYPVVYVIGGNGADENDAVTGLKLADYAAQDKTIIVTPVEPEHNNLMPDWADGTHPLDHNFAYKLVPAIDAQFRTIRNRAHRAIAGISAGGYSSMAIAAHHPDLFVAASSFSGVVDITDRGAAGEATVEFPQVVFVDGNSGELFRRFGDPYDHPLSWHQRNPKDLARNFRGMNLYAGAGDGTPESADEAAQDGPTLGINVFVENQVRSMSDSFVGTLTGLRIPIFYRTHVGTHNGRHWVRDMAAWWPKLLAAIGTRAPRAFDYSSADAKLSVWSWSFNADPKRAPEFLDITAASPNGITLHGSGTEQVTTARIFRPGTRVSLTGATAPVVTAGRDGRISFKVKLGAPHTAEEYTSDAEGEVFTTRVVRFHPRGRRGRRALPGSSHTRGKGQRHRMPK